MSSAVPAGSEDQLRRKLREAQEAGDRKREVKALLDIARRAFANQDWGNANAYFAFAEKLIRRTGVLPQLLHEILGERALVMRRANRLDESLELYERAA